MGGLGRIVSSDLRVNDMSTKEMRIALKAIKHAARVDLFQGRTSDTSKKVNDIFGLELTAKGHEILSEKLILEEEPPEAIQLSDIIDKSEFKLK